MVIAYCNNGFQLNPIDSKAVVSFDSWLTKWTTENSGSSILKIFPQRKLYSNPNAGMLINTSLIQIKIKFNSKKSINNFNIACQKFKAILFDNKFPVQSAIGYYETTFQNTPIKVTHPPEVIELYTKLKEIMPLVTLQQVANSVNAVNAINAVNSITDNNDQLNTSLSNYSTMYYLTNKVTTIIVIKLTIFDLKSRPTVIKRLLSTITD